MESIILPLATTAHFFEKCYRLFSNLDIYLKIAGGSDEISLPSVRLFISQDGMFCL